MEKAEIAGKFRRRFKTEVNPEINTLKICKDKDKVFLEIIYSGNDEKFAKLNTDFIVGSKAAPSGKNLYFDPKLGINDLVELFLKTDSYTLVSCFGKELFTLEGCYLLAAKDENAEYHKLPNLFKIGTSELSHDCFFTWLLQWGDEKSKRYSLKLHECSKTFIKEVINSKLNYDKEIKSVSTKRQWKGVDIMSVINEEVVVIFENKTGTKAHSGQLSRYKEITTQWCTEKGCELVCVYLKTESESKKSLEKVKGEGYVILGRNELFKVFNRFDNIHSDIYRDFILQLNHLHERENSFLTKKISDWTYYNWIGLYKYLEDNINVSNWSYVNNSSGGFIGLWWYFHNWDGHSVYLQIEQGDLCFKIQVKGGGKSKARNNWYRIIKKVANEYSCPEINRPTRFGYGKFMTVAKISRENWLGYDHSTFDKEIVLANLKRYQDVLKYCLEYVTKENKSNKV